MARMRASAKVKPSDFAPSSLCPPPTTSTNVSSPSSSASKTGSVPEMTSLPNCSKALLTNSTPSLSAALYPRTNGGSGDAFLSTTPSLICNALFSTTSCGWANRDIFLTSLFSSKLSPLMNNAANELLPALILYYFMKLLNIHFWVWLICLPAKTSACIFKDTLRNDTQVFRKFKISFLTFVYIPSTSTLLLTS